MILRSLGESNVKKIVAKLLGLEANPARVEIIRSRSASISPDQS
ncbi:unannotated protein [freshwater metagenome]|uniref:Unannotated protein n=1 Tax=freshwater metagenome TaxID=449393 RepID=A0A6J7A6L2_9ZZZZ